MDYILQETNSISCVKNECIETEEAENIKKQLYILLLMANTFPNNVQQSAGLQLIVT